MYLARHPTYAHLKHTDPVVPRLQTQTSGLALLRLWSNADTRTMPGLQHAKSSEQKEHVTCARCTNHNIFHQRTDCVFLQKLC